MNDDIAHAHWMRHALMLARRAEAMGEVPVGAVLVRGDEILGEGWNQSIAAHDPSAHAEIVALRAAGQREKNYRLVNGTTLYVTLEPCTMCAGALVQARVERLVFGARDPKTGAAGGVFNLVQSERLNHQMEIVSGIFAAECGQLLQNFFQSRRK